MNNENQDLPDRRTRRHQDPDRLEMLLVAAIVLAAGAAAGLMTWYFLFR